MVRCLPGCDTRKCPSSQYPVLKVHAPRLIRSDRAARQGDILPDRRGARGGNRALHILFTNELEGPENSQGLIGGHSSQTDRMTSVILLSDVDVLALYPINSRQLLMDTKSDTALNNRLNSNGALSNNDRTPLLDNSPVTQKRGRPRGLPLLHSHVRLGAVHRSAAPWPPTG